MQAWRTRGQGLDSRDSFVTPRKAGVKSSNIIATPKQPLKLTPPTPNELPGSSNAAASIRKNLIELSRQEDPEPILPPNFGHHDTITRYIMEKYGTPVIFGRGFGWHNPLHVPQDDPKPQILPDTRPKFRPESILANPNPDPTPVINPSKIQSVCSDLPQRRPFQELNCNVPVGKSIDSIEIIDDRSALYCALPEKLRHQVSQLQKKLQKLEKVVGLETIQLLQCDTRMAVAIEAVVAVFKDEEDKQCE
ncbi:hypothetical protein OUZ56_003599 [Daphnia magna]|uniref:Uncharacterized protein n=1 Tax=Daphnia magna TaxID=35525 RepID=A0ABR0A9F4_9CRUS|nr:hypothetical protein OUZ56_003599 [Daphnia magna]